MLKKTMMVALALALMTTALVAEPARYLPEGQKKIPIIRKMESVAGQIAISPRPTEFHLTYTHRDLGRHTDCRGVLTAEIIVGSKTRLIKDLTFEFSDVAPSATHTMRFGRELLDAVREANSDIDAMLIKYDKNSDYLDIKEAYCFFGPPADTKIIAGNPRNLARLYVHASAVHLLFDNKQAKPYEHYRCTFGITAKLAKSKDPDIPMIFTVSTKQVRPLGLTHVFGGIKAIQERREREQKPDLEYDYEPGRTQVVNRYCWRSGEAQLTTNNEGGFALLPGGKEVVWYSAAKGRGVISELPSEKDGPSLDSAIPSAWQQVITAKDGGLLAVDKGTKVSLYDSHSFSERNVVTVPENHGEISLHAAENLLVVGDQVLDSLTGQQLHRFADMPVSHDFSPDGKHLVVSFAKEASKTTVFTVGEWQTAREQGAFTGGRFITVAPGQDDGSQLYLFASGTYVVGLDIATGALARNIDIGEMPLDMTLSDDGKVLAVLQKTEMSFWDYNSGEKLLALPYTGEGLGVRIVKRGRRYMVGLKRRLVRKNLLDFWTLRLFPPPG